MNERSKVSRSEDAYALWVAVGQRPIPTQLWLHGSKVIDQLLTQGGVVLVHMESEPSVQFDSDFEFVRFFFSKETLDELCAFDLNQNSQGLRRPDFGFVDPLLFHLASCAVPLLQRGELGDQVLIDQLALAVHTRLRSAYSGAPRDERPMDRGGLSPWQERRAKDFISANLQKRLSIQDISMECRMSPSYFSRAFKHSTGRPPHRWILEQRIEAAKSDLAKSPDMISEISEKWGFTDPSHFSRIFFKMTGEAPTAWRRSWSRPSE